MNVNVADLHVGTLMCSLSSLSSLSTFLASLTPSCASTRKHPILDHVISPTDTQRCANTQNSIACPPRVNCRAFQPKISDNSQNRSACSPIACDRSKQPGEEGWMRFEVVKCLKALLPIVQYQPHFISPQSTAYQKA